MFSKKVDANRARNGSIKKIATGVATERSRSPGKRSAGVIPQKEELFATMKRRQEKRKTEKVKQELEQLFTRSPPKTKAEM